MDEDNILDVEQSDETGNVGDLSDSDTGSGADSVEVMTDEELAELEEGDVSAYALGGGSYGTISDTYLDYFEGIVQKLSPEEHYVIWKSGDYEYTLAYGEEVTESDGIFTGLCDVVRIYRDSSGSYNSVWYVETASDSLSLDSSQLFVYSDLGMYSTIERGVSSLEANTILFAIGFSVVYSVCHDMFDYVLGHLRR